MKIKDILKLERNKRKLTQQQVSEYLHIERGSYAKYENGTNTPTVENILKLADFYNVSTDYLLGRYEIKTPDNLNVSFKN